MDWRFLRRRVPTKSIRGDVQKALLYNAATAKMPIHATVRGGIVTLTGSVQFRQEKQLAERIADGVRGVRLAQIELISKGDAKRDDGTVANDVKSRLAWDVLVENDPITATVKDAQMTLAGAVGSAAKQCGKVMLTGTVQTFRERSVASESALEAGAVSVDNELKVGSLDCRPPSLAETRNCGQARSVPSSWARRASSVTSSTAAASSLDSPS